MVTRPRLAVWKFASCDGCQLALLDCEDELLTIAARVEIAHFPEASSHSSPGRYDISLVEGSISAPEHLERIRQIRADSTTLVAIGACATAGGIQSLRNFADAAAYTRTVYPRPDWIDSLPTATPITDHVPVDFELRGCPIDKRQLLELLGALLAGRRPRLSKASVCVECKLRCTVCVMVARGTPCLGPVTQAGCGAICPAYDRGCYGCHGPCRRPADASLERWWREQLQVGAKDVERARRSFNAWAPSLRDRGTPE